MTTTTMTSLSCLLILFVLAGKTKGSYHHHTTVPKTYFQPTPYPSVIDNFVEPEIIDEDTYGEMLEGLDTIDLHLNDLKGQLDNAISTSQEAIINARRTSNYRSLSVAAGISLGRLLQEYASHVDDTTITYGKILTDVGSSFVTGGYAGARVASTKPLQLKCGIENAQRVLLKYDILFHLTTTYDSYILEAGPHEHPLAKIPAEVFPEALEFTVDDFQEMLSNSLSCLLSEGGISGLKLLIEKITDTLYKRLSLTAKLFAAINKDYVTLLKQY